MREPQAKNSFNVPRSVWSRWSQMERHHFNKLFLHLYQHQEQFDGTKKPLEDWSENCKAIALFSADLLRRGLQAEYYRR